MATKNGAWTTPLALTLTAGTNAPDWNLTGSTGVYIGLASALADEANFDQTTTAYTTYTGGTWGITELSTSGGYTAAGIALPTPSWATAGASTGQLIYTAGAAVWTSSGGGFTLNPGGMFVYSNNATTKYMMFQLVFTGGPYTASGGGTFTVTPPAAGMVTLTVK